MYRISGIYAPANGEFSTAAFDYPAGGVYVNAEATWQGGTVTGGCDEGCNAYIFAELLDANTGAPIAGYTRNESEPMMNVTGIKLPLRWKGTEATKAAEAKGVTSNANAKPKPCVLGVPGCPVVGHPVQLRLFFRDATIFAVGAL
jgi:hypothetical protein